MYVWDLIKDLDLYVVLKLVSFALDTVAGFDVVLSTKREKKIFLQGMPLSEVTPGLFTSAMVTDLVD